MTVDFSEKKETAGPSNTSSPNVKRKEIKKKGSKTKMGGAEMFGLTVRKRVESPEMKLREKTFQKDPFGNTSLNLRSSSSTFNKQSLASRYTESPSGIFLYVDMHGHATKRGTRDFLNSNTKSNIIKFPIIIVPGSSFIFVRVYVLLT